MLDKELIQGEFVTGNPHVEGMLYIFNLITLELFNVITNHSLTIILIPILVFAFL